MTEKQIILFDGVCNFCNASVNFIIKRDPKKIFVFTPIQSDYAKSLLNIYKIGNISNDTFILIKNNVAYTRSKAALEIATNLSGFWPLLKVFIIIPSPVRDFFYNVLAKNRYKFFGLRDACVLPTPEIKDRFFEK